MKRIAIAVVIVAVIAGALALFAAWGAKKAKGMIEEGRHDIAGLALEIGGYELSFGRARLLLRDIKIYPAGHEDEGHLLASAETLSVNVAPRALLRGTLRAREIRLENPVINYAITGRDESNWDALDLGTGEAVEDEGDAGDKGGLPLIVDSVVIEDGEVNYRDSVKGGRLELTRVDIEIDDIRKAKKPGELPTSFKLSAGIGKTGGTLTVEGRADLFGEGLSFDLAGAMSATPIGAFSSFYAGSVPFPITAGGVAVKSRGTARNNILTSSHHATISGLRVGGQKGALINKYVLSQTGPIGVDASVNGDLGGGKLSVSAALSKNLAEELMRRAAAGVAGAAAEMAIEKIKEVAPSPARAVPSSSVKKGIEGLLKKR